MTNFEQMMVAIGDGVRAARRQVFMDVLGAYCRYRAAMTGSETIGRGRATTNLVIFANSQHNERVEYGAIVDMFASIASNRGLGVGMYDGWIRGAIRAQARQLRRDYNAFFSSPADTKERAEARERLLTLWKADLDGLDAMCRELIALPDVVDVAGTFYEVEIESDINSDGAPVTEVWTNAPCPGCGDASWRAEQMSYGMEIQCECGAALRLQAQPAFTQEPQTVVMV